MRLCKYLQEQCAKTSLTNCRITTYRTLISQFISLERLRELAVKYEEDPQTLQEMIRSKLGALFRVNWYRVILDEAHMIKNIRSASEFGFP